MIRIIEEKNSGKTRKLMEACADNYGVFVCANPYAAREKAHAYGIVGIRDFISYEQFMSDIYAYTNYFIDELENMFKNRVGGYTISLE